MKKHESEVFNLDNPILFSVKELKEFSEEFAIMCIDRWNQNSLPGFNDLTGFWDLCKKMFRDKFEGIKDDKEELFLSIIDGYVIKEKYPNSVFYFNSEGKVLFELDKKYSGLWCNYELVWNVFEDTYGMDYNEVQSFITKMAFKYLNINAISYPLSYFDNN